MLKIALKNKPSFVCIVPEKRNEVTTEGGLNLNRKNSFLKRMIDKLKKRNIKVSLFIEPKISDIIKSKKLKADCVELHTGRFCNLFNKRLNSRLEYIKIKKAATYARLLNLEVHAGHGLSYDSLKKISKINSIIEFNIGHFIISESLFIGLKKAIINFKKIINKS